MAKFLERLTFEVEYPAGTWTAITPTVEDVVLVKKRENGQYFYRLSLETELLLLKTAWDFISEIEETDHCSEVNLRISCGTDLLYEGKLALNDGNFDFGTCAATLKATTEDNYACLQRSLKKDVNVLADVDETTLNFTIGEVETKRCPSPGTTTHIPVFYPAGVQPNEDSCLTELDGWVVIENNFSNVTPNGDGSYNGDLYTVWARLTVDSATQPPGIGWVNIGGTTWVKAPAFTFDQENSEDPPPNGTTSWVQYWTLDFAEQLPIDNGVPLANMMEFMLSDIDCPLTVVSNFFTINPDFTNPTNDVYTSAQEKLGNVLVFQISDVKRGDASNNATIGLMNFEELFNFFAMLKVFPSVDGDLLRIEHISYYENKPISLDLTAAPYYRWVKRKKKYTYANDDSPQFEKFAWGVNTNNALFNAPYPIEYGAACSNPENNSVTHNAERFVTDLQSVLDTPDLFPDDGFVVVNAIEFNGGLYADTEYGAIATLTEILNAHLSLPNILNRYWRNYAYQPSGYLNGSLVDFDSVRPNKRGEAITVPGWCCSDFIDFDPATLVTTPIGNGEVEKVTYSVKNGTATFELIYGGGLTS